MSEAMSKRASLIRTNDNKLVGKTTKKGPPISGRRVALAVLDTFLKEKQTRMRLRNFFERFLEEEPEKFVTKVLIPLTPKGDTEGKHGGTNVNIQVVSAIPRPQEFIDAQVVVNEDEVNENALLDMSDEEILDAEDDGVFSQEPLEEIDKPLYKATVAGLEDVCN